MARDMVQIRRGPTKSYSGPDARIGRSQFNRSCGLKTTFDASYVYPIFLDDVLPGDTFTMTINGFARIFSPLVSPVMDNIELEVFWFFCPTRILWENWVFFQGEHDAAGAQDTSFTVPVMATGWTVDHDNVKTGHGLAAHMGLPHGLATATVTGVSCLPFRMYNRVMNEWFADQNIQGSTWLTQVVTNTADAVTIYGLQRSNKKHDYFTSCLPYLQKGTAVTVSGDVIGDVTGAGSLGSPALWASDSSPAGGSVMRVTDTGTDSAVKMVGAFTANEQLYWEDPELVAVIDINALRQSVAIQRLLELDARGGTRYVENIKAHFGVTSPDFRLQRPEYLGGGKSFITISPVANTSGVDAAAGPGTVDIHQGELAGVGTGVLSGMGFSKSFTEHGLLMGLIRARGDLTYFQGLDRMWSRSTRYDFYIPALANLGEQSVLNKEIWISNSAGTDDAVFGYQERWAEYRMKPSRLAGAFNPDSTTAIDQWHLAEDFGSLPSLNAAFINDQTPMSRVVAVTSQPDFLLDLWFNYKCARPIPVKSIPSLTNRF